MADVQAEHGFTKIADALFEAILRTPMAGRQKDVLFALVRLTYGYQKTKDRIAVSQIAQLIACSERNTRRAMAALIERGVIIDHTPNDSGRPHQLQIQKNFDLWGPHIPDVKRTRSLHTPDSVARATKSGPQYHPGQRGPDFADQTPDNVARATPDNVARHQRQRDKTRESERPPAACEPDGSHKPPGGSASESPGGSVGLSDPAPLLNLIARLDGQPDEKRAWLEHELPVIEVEADGNPGKLRSNVVRFYRQYLKGDRPFQDHDRKQRRHQRMIDHQAKLAADIEELEAEEGHAAAHR